MWGAKKIEDLLAIVGVLAGRKGGTFRGGRTPAHPVREGRSLMEHVEWLTGIVSVITTSTLFHYVSKKCRFEFTRFATGASLQLSVVASSAVAYFLQLRLISRYVGFGYKTKFVP